MLRTIPPVFFIIVISLTVACSSKNYPNGNSFPGDTPKTSKRNKPVVSRDGTVIDRDGRVLGNANDLPPGQAKKVYGSRSAKAYAPGQRKKAGNNKSDNKHNRDNNGRKKHKGKG